MYRIDEIFDVADATAAWHSLAVKHGVASDDVDNAARLRGRSYPRRFNKSKVSDERYLFISLDHMTKYFTIFNANN